MSHQLHFEIGSDSFRHVLPLSEWSKEIVVGEPKPFSPAPFLSRVLSFVLTHLIRFVEYFLQRTLYIDNDAAELALISKHSRALLLKLLRHKIIDAWHFAEQASDAPRLPYCLLKLSDFRTPSGRRFGVQGQYAAGVGNSLNQALIPAMAEAIERHALCSWDESKIVRARIDHPDRRFVPLEQFVPYSKSQLSLADFQRFNASNTQKVGRVRAIDFVSGAQRYVPAQAVYINYEREHLYEPVFMQTTSNGTAVATSPDEAVVKGILEAIERDGLFIHWLNRLNPKKVDLASVTDAKIQTLVVQLERYHYELHILDLSTDLEIPVFCAVIIDPLAKKAVSIGAGAGFDISLTIQKVITEAMRFMHDAPFESSSKTTEQILAEASHITSFALRGHLWSRSEMVHQIQFFISGDRCSYNSLVEKFRTATECITLAAQSAYLKTLLARKNYECYVVDVTTRFAREAGVYAYKAIVPELVPPYFDEAKKPLGRSRIYTVPVHLKILTEPLTPNQLNQVPHPFL